MESYTLERNLLQSLFTEDDYLRKFIRKICPEKFYSKVDFIDIIKKINHKFILKADTLVFEDQSQLQIKESQMIIDLAYETKYDVTIKVENTPSLRVSGYLGGTAAIIYRELSEYAGDVLTINIIIVPQIYENFPTLIPRFTQLQNNKNVVLYGEWKSGIPVEKAQKMFGTTLLLQKDI